MNEQLDTSSEGTLESVNESDQFFEEEVTPEGIHYSITLTETVGMESNP